jgi:hypothetical protein
MTDFVNVLKFNVINCDEVNVPQAKGWQTFWARGPAFSLVPMRGALAPTTRSGHCM